MGQCLAVVHLTTKQQDYPPRLGAHKHVGIAEALKCTTTTTTATKKQFHTQKQKKNVKLFGAIPLFRFICFLCVVSNSHRNHKLTQTGNRMI